MKVEIWSDIMCPFCNMGKFLFESALKDFPHQDEVEVEWKSFLLSPELKTDPQLGLKDYLSKTKGMSPHDVDHMTGNIVERAKTIGLDFHFEKVVVANTIKAHTFIKFAQEMGKGSEAYEAIFRAYFVEGKNVDDLKILTDMALNLNLDSQKYLEALENKTLELKVHNDFQEAQGLGIQGVPFFVFDRKLAVSGAQDKKIFLEALQKAHGK